MLVGAMLGAKIERAKMLNEIQEDIVDRLKVLEQERGLKINAGNLENVLKKKSVKILKEIEADVYKLDMEITTFEAFKHVMSGLDDHILKINNAIEKVNNLLDIDVKYDMDNNTDD